MMGLGLGLCLCQWDGALTGGPPVGATFTVYAVPYQVYGVDYTIYGA